MIPTEKLRELIATARDAARPDLNWPQSADEARHTDYSPAEGELIAATTPAMVADLCSDLLIQRSHREAALRLHHDAGESQGYDTDGHYGTLPHCCATCGEHGEYGVPYPCPTARALGVTREGE